MTHLPIFDPPELASAALPTNGRRHAIQPADVRGRFRRARRLAFGGLIALWAALPWVRVRGNPALFLDVDARRFFLFGATFNAQDTWLLFFLLTGIGFGLVYATAWPAGSGAAGRVRRRSFSRACTGPSSGGSRVRARRRLRRNAGPWTVERLVRKTVTHALYVVAALLVAHIFLSYFASLPADGRDGSRQSPGDAPRGLRLGRRHDGALLRELRLVPRAALRRRLPVRAPSVGAARRALARRRLRRAAG